MEPPQRTRQKLPRASKLARAGPTSPLRNTQANESHARPQGGASLVQISSLPGSLTRQPATGSMAIPNTCIHSGQLAQGSLSAHNPPSSPLPRVSPVTTGMPRRNFKRSRIPQEEPIASPDVKTELPQNEEIPPPAKRRRKTKKVVSPATIAWKVVSNPELSRSLLEPPVSEERSRGRGRGGADGMFATADVPSDATPTDFENERANPRQWSSGKDELFAILPELATHVNGIAEFFETPIIILDGRNGITVSAVDGIVMQLSIVRDFICERPKVVDSSSLEPLSTAAELPDKLPQFSDDSVPPKTPVTSVRETPSNFDSRPRLHPPSRPTQQWNNSVRYSYYEEHTYEQSPDSRQWNEGGRSSYHPSHSRGAQQWNDDGSSYYRERMYNQSAHPRGGQQWNNGDRSSYHRQERTYNQSAHSRGAQHLPLVHSSQQLNWNRGFNSTYPSLAPSSSQHFSGAPYQSSHYPQRWSHGYQAAPQTFLPRFQSSHYTPHSAHQPFIQPDERSLEAIRSIPLPEGLIALDVEDEEELTTIVSFPSPAPRVSSNSPKESITYPSTPLRWRQYNPNVARLSSNPSEDMLPLKLVDEQRSPSILSSESKGDIPKPTIKPRTPPSHISIPPQAPAAILSSNIPSPHSPPLPPPSSPGPAPETSTVPRPIPKEVELLINAYIQNTPVLCIASNGCMTNSWGVKLPTEIDFAYLGFWSVVGVQEERVPVGSQQPASSDLAGRVKWHFKLQWGSGGEADLGLPSDTLAKTVFPWWLPQGSAVAESSRYSADNDASTPEYKKQRLESHNYAFRDIPIANHCPSVLPAHLLDPHNDSADLGFDQDDTVEEQTGWCREHKGWYCVECGKLNRVMMMRHRRCNSSFCGSKNSDLAVGGYSVPLESIRTPHQTTPIYLPKATLPPGIDVPTPLQWPDGMMVLRYVLGINKPRRRPQRRWYLDGEVSVRHIFTGNMPSLQADATELLDSIQTDCPLLRDGFDSPYFSHTAVMTRTPWPDCLARAREIISRSIKTYVCAENQDIDINRIVVKGWVDRSGRNAEQFHIDSGNCAAMMCLGHELKLKIFPKSQANSTLAIVKKEDGAVEEGMGSKGSNSKVEQKLSEDAEKPVKGRKLEAGAKSVLKSTTMVAEIRPERLYRSPGDNSKDQKSKVLDEASPQVLPAPSAPAQKVTRRTKPQPLITTLVHGDILFLSGDEYDYSILRSGTSILLVAFAQ
ncbi:hypothetical protein C8R45DRAFT_998054 [Mycena sanguinolenta]|nr:hypothetical protein C8R45DRAFT_998054 [Mycena sanguinolenta]